MAEDAAWDLEDWLASIKLERYFSNVRDEGYDELEFLLGADEADISEMTATAGMKKPHAKAFLGAWQKLELRGGASAPASLLQLQLPDSSSSLEVDRADPASRIGYGGGGVVFRGWRVSKSGKRCVAVPDCNSGHQPVLAGCSWCA